MQRQFRSSARKPMRRAAPTGIPFYVHTLNHTYEHALKFKKNIIAMQCWVGKIKIIKLLGTW